MNVAIVSAWSADFSPLAQVTLPNIDAFCKHKNFDLITDPNWTGDRGPQWGRMELALKHLARYDALFVMDIDAIITNFDYDFDWLLKISPYLTATQDINGFNCGMMILQQSVWTLDFMRRYWEAGKNYANHINPEQTCMAHMLICEPQSAWSVVRQREFNSFRYEEYNYGPYPEGQWREGDFIMHLPSLPNERRIEIFNEYLSSHR
jgi:hypothetical protein